MQLSPQNNIQSKVNQNFSSAQQVPCSHCQNSQAAATPQPVQCTTNNNNYCTPPLTNGSYPAGYISTQNMYPQYVPSANTNITSPQNIQIPANASGVNIQIFNPTVGTPGSTNNINAPCYPSSYYTNTIGADGKMTDGKTVNSKTVDGQSSGNKSVDETSDANSSDSKITQDKLASTGQNGDNTNNGTVNGNVNTGTNNGTIGNNNNSNNTTNNNTTIDNTEKKKTEKRKIVELNDDYIKNLETYLNSQDKQVRLNAAKEVYARLEEDESRFDDKALTALINKMLQDPSREIRFLALTALDGRICKGDEYTIGVLQKMQQNSDDPLNQEAADASSILLKMSAKQVEKEFEVKNKNDKKSNESSKK